MHYFPNPNSAPGSPPLPAGNVARDAAVVVVGRDEAVVVCCNPAPNPFANPVGNAPLKPDGNADSTPPNPAPTPFGKLMGTPFADNGEPTPLTQFGALINTPSVHFPAQVVFALPPAAQSLSMSVVKTSYSSKRRTQRPVEVWNANAIHPELLSHRPPHSV